MQETLKVNIPTYSTDWVNGKQVVFYQIKCNLSGKSWELKRRYKEFSDLNEVLKNNHGNLPPMPGKSLFKLKKPEQLEKRKMGLNSYLRDLVGRMDVYSNNSFIDFFELNQHNPDVKTNNLGMIGRVTHTLMGYRDIILLPEKKLFFSVTSDMNAISRYV